MSDPPTNNLGFFVQASGYVLLDPGLCRPDFGFVTDALILSGKFLITRVKLSCVHMLFVVGSLPVQAVSVFG